MAIHLWTVDFDPARDEPDRVSVTMRPNLRPEDLARNVRWSFDLDSNGCEMLGYQALEAAACLLEKRAAAEPRVADRVDMIRQFLEDVRKLL